MPTPWRWVADRVADPPLDVRAEHEQPADERAGDDEARDDDERRRAASAGTSDRRSRQKMRETPCISVVAAEVVAQSARPRPTIVSRSPLCGDSVDRCRLSLSSVAASAGITRWPGGSVLDVCRAGHEREHAENDQETPTGSRGRANTASAWAVVGDVELWPPSASGATRARCPRTNRRAVCG